MVGLIERRPDQIVHGGVHDREGLLRRRLHVEHARDEDAGIPGDHASRLEQKPHIEIAHSLVDQPCVVGRERRGRFVAPVRDAEAAAEIDELDAKSGAPQGLHKLLQQREGIAERGQVGDLAADMHVDARGDDPWQLRGLPVERRRQFERDAELVLGLAGRNLVVGPGVHVGVYAEGDTGGLSHRAGDLAQGAQFRLRLDVKRENARVQRERHLVLGLADARESDAFAGYADGQRAADLALGHDIHACASPRQRRQHAEIRVGLDGIADKRAGSRGEGVGEHIQVPLEGRGGVAVERRSDLSGERA